MRQRCAEFPQSPQSIPLILADGPAWPPWRWTCGCACQGVARACGFLEHWGAPLVVQWSRLTSSLPKSGRWPVGGGRDRRGVRSATHGARRGVFGGQGRGAEVRVRIFAQGRNPQLLGPVVWDAKPRPLAHEQRLKARRNREISCWTGADFPPKLLVRR